MIRTLHRKERHYLNLDAQSMVYRYLACQEIPNEIVEKAIDEAVAHGRAHHRPVDAEILSTFVDAFFIDSFYGPSWALHHRDGSSIWTC